MIEHNMRMCTGASGFSDFMPIGVFTNEKESIDFMRSIEPRLIKRGR
jgi:hypothetical protein